MHATDNALELLSLLPTLQMSSRKEEEHHTWLNTATWIRLSHTYTDPHTDTQRHMRTLGQEKASKKKKTSPAQPEPFPRASPSWSVFGAMDVTVGVWLLCACVCHLSVCHLSSDVTFTHRYFLPTLPATLLTQLHWANEQTLIKWYRHTHTHLHAYQSPCKCYICIFNINESAY